MVMDLKNVFRRMIQIGFIDGIGLRGYGICYVWGRSEANVLWQQAIVMRMTKLL
jgi:hypothetical protein